MGRFSNEVLGVARQIDCQATELPENRRDFLVATLRERFTDGVQDGPLWEHLVNDASIQDPTAWSWVEDYVGHQKVIMFFDDELDKSAVLFEDGGCVVPTLAECTGFEFYLTDCEMNYVVNFNHHDFLIAVGEAVEWIEIKRSNAT